MRKLGLFVIFFIIFMVFFLISLYNWMVELDRLGWELYRHPLPFQYIFISFIISLGLTKLISSKVWKKKPKNKDTN